MQHPNANSKPVKLKLTKPFFIKCGKQKKAKVWQSKAEAKGFKPEDKKIAPGFSLVLVVKSVSGFGANFALC